MTRRLQNQVALVTGGGTGVGAAIALALARSGANLLLVGRRVQKLEAVASAARSEGVRATAMAADIGDADGLAKLVAALAVEQSRLDILVHSAALFTRKPIEEASSADFDAIYKTNVRAPFLLTQALLARLKASLGQVVFINSSSGNTAKPALSQYGASKHALRALADSLRAEVNASGVRVLSVYLGRTASEMQARLHAEEGRAYCPELLLQPEDVADVVLNALFLPRTAEMTDVHIRPMHKA